MIDYKVGDLVQRSDKTASNITPRGIYRVTQLNENESQSVWVINDTGREGSYWRSEFTIAKSHIIHNILKEI
jgi:hypothetical protein